MEVIRDIKAHKINFLKTCFIYLMFLVVGLGIAIPGPTLLDLQIAVNCTLQEIGYLLPGRAFGYATGSLLGGFVPEKADKQPFVIAFFTLCSLFLGFLPWNRTLVGLIATALLNGLFMGATEVCGNVLVLEFWGAKSSSFIQVLYLFFGLGAFIAPLITEPFLLPLIDRENEGFQGNSNSNLTIEYISDDVKIHYPYFFVASFAIIVSFFFTIIYCIRRENKTHSSFEDIENENSKSNSYRILIAVMLGTIFLHFYFGNEITFGIFLTAYVVKSDLKFDKSSGAFMTSVFWGTFTFFRLLVIVITDFVGIGKALFIEILLTLIGCGLFIFGSVFTTNATIVWVATVVSGLGLSAIYALTLGYLQQYFVISSKMVSSFLITACVGEFMYPLFTARFMEPFPNIFVVITTTCTISLSIVFIILTIYCRYWL